MGTNGKPLYTRAMAEEVVRLANIIEIITPHTELRPQGNGEWSGLCPFHREKTPSFYVNEGKGVYFCYGCQKKGNAITFLKDIEGMTFSGAVSKLRRMVGLPELSQTNHQLEDISVNVRSIGRFVEDGDSSNFDKDQSINEVYTLAAVLMQAAETGRFVLDRDGIERFDAIEGIYKGLDDAVAAEDWDSLIDRWERIGEDMREI